MFATGQSVRPEPGRGRTAACRPVRSFSKVARQVGIKDEDGRHSVVPSRLFLNLPDKKNSGIRTDEIVSSPVVPRRPPPSSAVFRCFPLYSAVACRPPSSPAVLHHPLPSPTTPYKNMTQIVGLVVLPNDGRPGNSRTRTDGILSSRPVIFSSCPTSRNERRGRTTFCRPVSSRALGSLPAGPYGGPGRLRTLHNPNLFLKPHSVIAEVCLTYLNFRHVSGFSPALRFVPPTAPFVEYASCYWGTHARRETTESVKNLALRLLDKYDKHISSKILLLRGMPFWYQPFDRKGTPRGFTGLHGAAYLGYVEITVALLEADKWDVQATDFHGNTAIAWAARRGQEGVVKVLLGRSDVSPDEADKWSRTPLLWAAENGHEEVVRMLLERNGINLNRADKWS